MDGFASSAGEGIVRESSAALQTKGADEGKEEEQTDEQKAEKEEQVPFKPLMSGVPLYVHLAGGPRFKRSTLNPKPEEQTKIGTTLVKEEERDKGAVSLAVYLVYWRAWGGWHLIFMMACIYVIVQFLAEGVDFWLAIWGLSFVDGAESPV